MLKNIDRSLKLLNILINKYFRKQEYMFLSYCISEENIKKGIRRIKESLSEVE